MAWSRPALNRGFWLFFSKKEELAASFDTPGLLDDSAVRRRVAAWALLLCAVLSEVCIVYVDQPVALFFHAHQGLRLLFQAMAAPSLLSLPCALVYLTGYVISAPFGRPPGKRARQYLGLSLAVLVATAVKDELKWAFGRPWPSGWFEYGFYRFTPFTDRHLYGAFPSGHTAYIAAPLCLMCWLAPRYKALWLGVIGMVMFGLVAAGYHYPGDVVAGFFVGLASAAGVAMVMPKMK